MQLSTKTTKHTFSLPQTRNLFAGNGMAEDCRIVKNNRSKVADYQVVKMNCNFRNSRKQGVKEIKCGSV